jgi:hypothetical protein
MPAFLFFEESAFHRLRYLRSFRSGSLRFARLEQKGTALIRAIFAQNENRADQLPPFSLWFSL